MTSLPQSAFNAAVSPQHAKPQQTVRPISGIGAALAIVTAIVVLLLTTAGSRGANATPVSDYTAAGPKQELPQPPGGGYTDASGVAYNASTGELLVVDNRTDEILIYDGDPNWTWNRTVALGGLGIQDLEGITWMGGNKYAVSDEFGSGGGRPNELLVFTLNGTTATELYRGTLTGMPQVVNGGAEGVAFVSSAGGVDTFYAVGETGTLWRVTGQNNTLSLQQITVNDTGATPLGDFSDIAYFEADVNGVATPTIYITNQEGVSGGKVRSYTISGNTATRVGSDLTAGLTFIEGIAFNADASRMFLAGEVDIELREFTLDNAGGGDTIWTFQNVVHGGYLRQDDGSINVSMSATNDTRAQWRITSDATGTILQNVATGRYLDADGTNSGGNVDTSTDVLFDDHWVVVNNGASGFTIQNVDTNGYIDGDGVGVNVDQSISVGADDYWTRIIVNAGETPTPTPDPGPGALPNDPTVTFGAIGDWGVPDQGAPAVAALMDQANPDIIVTVGDNRYGNNSFDNVVGRHYCRWVKDAQSGPNCPSGGDADINRFFPATGNHDYTDGAWRRQDPSCTTTSSGVQSTSSSSTRRHSRPARHPRPRRPTGCRLPLQRQPRPGRSRCCITRRTRRPPATATTLTCSSPTTATASTSCWRATTTPTSASSSTRPTSSPASEGAPHARSLRRSTVRRCATPASTGCRCSRHPPPSSRASSAA